MNEDKLHTRVGAVSLVALGALVAMVLALEGKHLRPGMHLHIQMSRSGALVAGSKVRIAGRDIGSVDTIRLVPREEAPTYADDPTAERAGVVLDVWIDARWHRYACDNCDYFQNQPSVLGEAYLEIGPPLGGAEAGPPLPDGASVRGADPPRLDRIAQKSYENLRQVTELFKDGLPEARALGHELDGLDQALDGLAPDGAIDALGDGRRKLWVEGVAAYDAYQSSGFSPEAAEHTVARGRQVLAKARARIAVLRGKLDVVLENIDALRVRLDPDRFEKLLSLTRRADELLAKNDALLANIDEIAAMVQRGEGTIGAFLNDTELADEFKAMTKVLKSRPWETIGHPPR